MSELIKRNQSKMFNFIKKYINTMADKKFKETKCAEYFYVEELETDEYFKFSYYKKYIINDKENISNFKYPENLHEFISEFYMDYIDFSLLLNLFEQELGSLNIKKAIAKIDNVGLISKFNSNNSFSLGTVTAEWESTDEYEELYYEDNTYSFYTTKEGFLYEDYPDSHELLENVDNLNNNSVNLFRKIYK